MDKEEFIDQFLGVFTEFLSSIEEENKGLEDKINTIEIFLKTPTNYDLGSLKEITSLRERVKKLEKQAAAKPKTPKKTKTTSKK